MIFQLGQQLLTILLANSFATHADCSINPTNSTVEKYKDDIPFKLKLAGNFYERKFRKVVTGPVHRDENNGPNYSTKHCLAFFVLHKL